MRHELIIRRYSYLLGKLTPQMIEAIRKEYADAKSYTKVGAKLGLNWKTVKAHIPSQSLSSSGTHMESDMTTSSSSVDAISRNNNDLGLYAESNDKKGSSKHEPSSSINSPNNQKPVRQQKSCFARALRLFEKGLTPSQVAIEIDLPFADVTTFYSQYGKLEGLHSFYNMCATDMQNVSTLLKLHKMMLEENMNPKQFAAVLKYCEPLQRIKQRHSELEETVQQQIIQVDLGKKSLEEIEKSIAVRQKQISDTADKKTALDRQLHTLEGEISKKQNELTKLNSEGSAISNLIHTKQEKLEALRSKQGPLWQQIRKQARESALELMNDNNVTFASAVAAILNLIQVDPRFLNDCQNYPRYQGEPPSVFLQRSYPYFKMQYLAVFEEMRKDLASRVAYGIPNSITNKTASLSS